MVTKWARHEGLERIANDGIKAFQGRRMVAMGHNAGGKDEFAERGAVAEKQQSNLWVWELAKFLEKLGGLGHAFLSVLVAAIGVAYASTPEFKTPIVFEHDVAGELVAVHGVVGTSCWDKLALIRLQL